MIDGGGFQTADASRIEEWEQGANASRRDTGGVEGPSRAIGGESWLGRDLQVYTGWKSGTLSQRPG